MKLDEKALLDAMALASLGTPFDQCDEGEQAAFEDEARAFCVELARQARAEGVHVVPAWLLEAAFLPPKREPDVEAAVRLLNEMRDRDIRKGEPWEHEGELRRILRALGVEEDV